MFFLRRTYAQIRYVSRATRRLPLKRGLTLVFGRYLLFTNVWTSGTIMGLSDLIEQKFEGKQMLKKLNYERIGHMFLVGLSMGPVYHYYYTLLNRFYPGGGLRTTTKKILYDQLIMSPICICLFFYGTCLLENKTLEESTDELREKFLDVYMIDWSVWPPVQFINFYYLPLKYQVSYINFVTLFYYMYLSYMKHTKKEDLP